MVDAMGEGAVVIDMAADSGGNCELSEPGQDIVVGGVTVVGLTNPPASMPTHASFLYARNIANFLDLMVHEGQLAPDPTDEIIAGTCVVQAGAVVHGPTAEALGVPVASTAAAPNEAPPAAPPNEAPPASTPPQDTTPNDKETPS
jgi:NAD(P) transhydrogenase subunit alpha